MATTKDGGPAFPSPLEWEESSPSGEGKRRGCYDNGHDGMTLRDYFAAKALTGLLTNPNNEDNEIDKFVAADAYRMADAMLAARAAPLETVDSLRAAARSQTEGA